MPGRVILPLHRATVKASMQDRLTIDRPTALGSALARAVQAVCDRALAVAHEDLGLLDARLAGGDFEGVLARLRDAAPAPALPLFVARYVRWTADLQSAAALWPAVIASLDAALAADLEAALRRASCLELAATATDLGDVQLAARLHAAARDIGTGAPLPPPADPDARLVCDIAFGTIGIEADATRGRLRLRPRLDRIPELHVRCIRFGDASVSLSASRRDEHTVTVRVEQDAGAIPVTVLLEPFVPRPVSATVDGQPADLVPQRIEDGHHTGRDPQAPEARSGAAGRSGEGGRSGEAGRSGAGGTIVPVQLVLDDARVLVVRSGPTDPT